MKKLRIAALFPLLFTASCTFHFVDEVKITNEADESKYFIGGSSIDAGDADTINIRWISGKIVIGYNEDNRFTFFEESKMNLSPETTLHYCNDIDKSVLYISPAASGTYKSKELEKDLFLNIPKDMELSKLNIDCVSSEITSTVKFSEAQIDAVSGPIEITSDKVGDLSIDNVSGNINLSLKEFNRVNVDTVSGNTVLKCPKDYAVNASLNTVSGKKNVSGVTENVKGKVVEVNSVSGSLTIKGELE
ncbi:MAG: DUF4097 domain-containing protein [Bacilli bacterium]|nr:DUF4097 domain-containing protein [Bacilli bacterium]